MHTKELSPFPKILVDVGGYRLAAFCAGTESPTVVLDAGMGDISEVWHQIQEAVSQFTCVCSYDRAGRGQSDPGPLPRTSQTVVNELHTLLTRIGLPGPYVLVGHSFGGFNVRLYAHQYPDDVGGIILVDSAHPDLDLVALLPPEASDENKRIREVRTVLRQETQETANPEGIDPVASAALVCAIPSLGAVPLVVLTHTSEVWIEMLMTEFPGFPRELATRLEQAWQEGQRHLLLLSSQSVQMVAQHSGHYIHHEEPELVVHAIRQVVDLVRKRNR
ncbi:alpha/beta fold hydrolase [Ktedonobacter racemifer]|uniref:Alpha/beta hydrolase fold protein n=1 Tax=Ktedonobacter racemifer DSM 44963 TaxID=485913 RepID=D6TWN7_KTERA|nr:alpha/beta hydrolase [Ktedonobacter racemifer]EFH84620.1 alpha/beta hydrolase fold protein [Ktedonobacter racemifer DSM 44963]